MIKLFGLLSPVIVPLIIAGLLLFSSEKKNIPKLYLAGYMLIITYVFAANLFYFEHNYNVYIWLHSLHIATVLAIYPGAYVYISLLTSPEKVFSKHLIHFIPSIAFFIASAGIFFAFLSNEEKIRFLTEYRFNPDFSKTWMKILYFVRMSNIAVLFIQVFVYLILILKVLRNHRRRVSEVFSNPEKFQLNWLRTFNISLALSAFICVFLYSANPAKLFGDDRYLAYPMLLIALILWFLGIMGNNQSFLPAIELHAELNNEEGQSSPSQLVKKLLDYFEEKKPYLNPELKIWDISKELGTNRTYISNTINRSFHQNFSSFVNSYRIKDAKEQLKSDPGKPLKILAEEVGFGSTTSFSRAFYELQGQKIQDYKKSFKK